MCLEQVLILKHVAYSGRDGHLLPCLEGLLGILDCSIEFVVGRLRNLADEFLSCLQCFLLTIIILTGLITSNERGPFDSTH